MANKTNREDTIRRIKALLELAGNNPSEQEAQAAALAAQRLIAQHHINNNELLMTAEEAIEEIKSGNYKGNPWAISLAHAVADNFRCRLYLTYEGYKSYYTNRTTKTDERIVFMGYETDATAAKETFDRLFSIGNRLADKECREARKKYGTSRGVKNSFLMGFVNGIRTELEKQCVALVLVRPKEVDDYADDRTSGFRTTNHSVRNTYDGSAYERGKQAGRDSMRGGRLGGQKALSA